VDTAFIRSEVKGIGSEEEIEYFEEQELESDE